MKVQVFYPNKDGKIEFTKKELEKLLQDVYDDGHSDGYNKGYTEGKNSQYWWRPYYTTTNTPNDINTTPTITWTATNTGDSTILPYTTSDVRNIEYLNSAHVDRAYN